MKGKYNMNTKQNLFTEEELAKVTDEAERKHLRFVKGRLKFGNSKQAAPFPSMVVIFRGAGM